MWSDEFGVLFGDSPGSVKTFGVMISKRKFGSVSVSTELNRITSVRLQANVDFVTVDSSTVKLVYQALDVFGHSNTLAPVSVIAIVTLGQDKSHTAACGSPVENSGGIASCAISIPAGWFSGDDSSLFSNSTLKFILDDGSEVLSNPVKTHLWRPADFSSSVVSGSNMVLTLPQKVFYPGDVVSVPVVATTAGQTLTSWVVTLEHDESVLEFLSVTTSSLYIAAVVSESPGRISMSTSGIASGVSESAVIGDNVAIATVSFRVVSGAVASADGADHQDVLSLMVNDMVNTFSIKFASNVQGVVKDNRDGFQTSGALIVASDGVAGIFAYSSQVEVVNTLPFSNVGSLSPTITVKAFSTKTGTISTVSARSTAVSCVATQGTDHVLTVSSACGVTVSNSLTAGGKVGVSISYNNDFFAEVNFNVWYPSEVLVTAAHDSLVAITADEAVPSPTCSMYQSTRVFVAATFRSELDSRLVYVTPLAKLASNASSVVSVDSTAATGGIILARGVRPGSATLTVQLFGNSATIQNTPADITVSDSIVSVTKLSLLSYTGVTGSAPSPVGSFDFANPSFSFADVLSSEGAKAYLTAVATLSDGSIEDVTHLLSSVTALLDDVAVDNESPGAPFVTVLSGASSFVGAGVEGVLRICDNSVVGYGDLNLTLPSLSGISVSKSTSRITSPSDIASSTPFRVAVSCTLFGVTVAFADGSSRDVSTDQRVSYSLSTAVEGSTLLYMVGNSVQVNTSSPDYFSGMHKSFSVVVGFNGAVFTTVALEVVTLSRVEMSTAAYPTYSGSDSISKTVIGTMGCGPSSSYQKLHAISRGYLTVADGANEVAVDVSNYVSYRVSDLSVLTTAGNGVISGVSAGMSVVTARMSLNSLVMESVGVSITVSSASVTLSDIAISTSVFSGGNTLTGLAGMTKTLKVGVIFSDGTKYTDAISGSSSAWFSVANELSFESSVPAAIMVSAEGVVELVGNYHSDISLTVASVCANPVSDVLTVYANLVADSYDVDMGSSSKAPFGSVNVGDSFLVPVRIQAGLLDVTSFQLELMFDSDVIQVASDSECSIGSKWTSAWDCTTNDPVNKVLIAGVCGLLPTSSCQSTGLVEVANIRFTAVGTGVSRITGMIVKLQDGSTSRANVAIVAGTGDVEVVANRRLMLDWTDADGSLVKRRGHPDFFHYDYIMSRHGLKSKVVEEVSVDHGRSLEQGFCLSGDTNGDGVFDVGDVVTLQYAVGGALDLSAVTPCQLVAMDPDNSGQRDGVDIQYLLRVVTKKYRFLKTIAIAHDDTYFSITSFVVNEASVGVPLNGQTRLQFDIVGEVGLSVTAADEVSTSALGIASASALYGENPGEFNIAVEHGAGMSVAAVLTTFDVYGETNSARQFAFYCTPSLASCASVYGNGMEAFKPYTALVTEVDNSPTFRPTISPTGQPTSQPSREPTLAPTRKLTDVAICNVVEYTSIGQLRDYGKWRCSTNGFPMSSPCANEWPGIVCDSKSPGAKILSISLSNVGLKGEFPPGLSGLPDLLYLDLSHSHLSGPLSADIENFESLRYLDIGSSYISGSLPTGIGSMTSLEYLIARK